MTEKNSQQLTHNRYSVSVDEDANMDNDKHKNNPSCSSRLVNNEQRCGQGKSVFYKSVFYNDCGTSIGYCTI